MDKYGLSSENMAEIKAVLARYPQIEQALIFGSRLTTNHKSTADIDLVLKGDLDKYFAFDIKFHLHEDTCVPYFFDVLIYNQLDSADLLENIDRQAQVIYSKTPASP